MEDENRVRCPECKQSISLWEGIEVLGWRALDARGRALSGAQNRGIDWGDARPDKTVGCGECGWEGQRAELEEIGLDDRPLTKNPDQTQIALEPD